eukprot:scaffold19301_cov44-Phaeocystis_antarctica.AAC.2
MSGRRAMHARPAWPTCGVVGCCGQRMDFSYARFESKAQGEGVIMSARNKVRPDSRRAGGTAATAARARSLGDRAQTPGADVRAKVEVRVGAEGGLPEGGGEGGRDGEAGGGTHLERVGAGVLDAAGLDEEFLYLHVIEDGRVAPPSSRTERVFRDSQDDSLEPFEGVARRPVASSLSSWACRAAQSHQGRAEEARVSL